MTGYGFSNKKAMDLEGGSEMDGMMSDPTLPGGGMQGGGRARGGFGQ